MVTIFYTGVYGATVICSGYDYAINVKGLSFFRGYLMRVTSANFQHPQKILHHIYEKWEALRRSDVRKGADARDYKRSFMRAYVIMVTYSIFLLKFEM